MNPNTTLNAKTNATADFADQLKLSVDAESVTVRIRSWTKFKGRGDVEHNSWFRCSNRLLEDHEFFIFSHEEMLVWIYILSLSSQHNTGEVTIYFAHADRVARLSRQAVISAVRKLSKKQIDVVDDTSTLRERNADDTETCATGQDITRQLESSEKGDEEPHSSKPPNESQPETPPPVKFGPRELAQAWNEAMAKVTRLRDPRKRMPLVDLKRFDSNDDRWRSARERLEKDPDPAVWLDAIERMTRSRFCRGGDGARGDWVASFAFLVTKGRLSKILEGEYGCTSKPKIASAPPHSPKPLLPKETANPDIVKAMKYAYVPGFTHTPWEDIKQQLGQQAAELIESEGGWDKFKQRPADENQEKLSRVLNSTTASGNPEKASQVHALAATLAGSKSMPEMRKGSA